MTERDTTGGTAGADNSRRYNRDEDLRPDQEGRPPRPATEPPGASDDSRRAPTATDPATGEPNP